MQIVYPYNEILPTKKAHDVYLFNNCVSLANQGFDVHLLIGEGSPSDNELFEHYHCSGPLHIHRLPISRHQKFPRMNSNRTFHRASQKFIKEIGPDVVITSVRKQGLYQVKRRIPGIRYLFEVHQLEWYPGMTKLTKRFRLEKEMFAKSDLIVVTTPALAKILREAPYSLLTPIQVISLATSSKPLPPRKRKSDVHAAYIGQLYPMQGVDLLIEAASRAPNVNLTIIGGAKEDIENLKKLANSRVTFHGFQSPTRISSLLEDVDVFLMPSSNLLDKPYVAHTKLIDYANLGRPIIAPNLPPVAEHLGGMEGITTYQAGDADSLAHALSTFSEEVVPHSFSWDKRAKHYASLL